MCGRFVLDATAEDSARQFEGEADKPIPSRYNIAPSQLILTVINAQKRSLAAMKWGLVPSWVKDLDSWKGNLINARAETVAEKPSFKGAFKHRPCLIPVSGFYEWSKAKQPYYFQQDSKLFAIAGLWESWSNGNEELVTCTIITTKANKQAAQIHHRSPVIIPASHYHLWLGEVSARKQLLADLPEADLQIYPVSKAVNSPKNDTAECIEPIAA